MATKITGLVVEANCNTKFFHTKASQRRQKNTIEQLKNLNGEWKEELGDVEEIVVNYFSNLYTSSTAQILMI